MIMNNYKNNIQIQIVKMNKEAFKNKINKLESNDIKVYYHQMNAQISQLLVPKDFEDKRHYYTGIASMNVLYTLRNNGIREWVKGCIEEESDVCILVNISDMIKDDIPAIRRKIVAEDLLDYFLREFRIDSFIEYKYFNGSDGDIHERY